MASTACLSGRVRVETIPRLGAGEIRPELPRKHLLLPQGDLVQVHNATTPIRYLAWIELKPGFIRGNHVHRIKHESLYVVSGALDLTVQDIETGEKDVTRLQSGDLVEIPPGIAHALVPLEAGAAIEFSPTVLDPSDTLRHPLVNVPTAVC